MKKEEIFGNIRRLSGEAGFYLDHFTDEELEQNITKLKENFKRSENALPKDQVGIIENIIKEIDRLNTLR